MDDTTKGQKLLTAVERLVASDEALAEMVAVCEAKAKLKLSAEALASKKAVREATADEVVRAYTLRATIAGGAAGVPGLFPGLGALAGQLAGAFAELAYLLKCEVELCLCLSKLYGFDITDARERQLAYLMASVGTYDARGGNFVTDVLKAEGVAMWNYGPRVLGRYVLKAMTALALSYVWRGFARLIPVVGIVIGSSVNRVLTQKVGESARKNLATRRRLSREAAKVEIVTFPKKKSKKLRIAR